MHDQYQNHTSEELGRIAHEGTLRTRQSAIAELVRRAKRSEIPEFDIEGSLRAALRDAASAHGRVETLEGKLRRIREEATA